MKRAATKKGLPVRRAEDPLALSYHRSEPPDGECWIGWPLGPKSWTRIPELGHPGLASGPRYGEFKDTGISRDKTSEAWPNQVLYIYMIDKQHMI